MRNRIINGAMQIWQRGTSTTNPASGNSNFYTADRWACNRASNVTGITVSRSASAPSGFQYSLALQRTAGNADASNGLYLFNSNETVNTLDLAGQQVTLSFYAKAGANYSGGVFTAVLNSGTGIDQPVYAYTGSNSFASLGQTLTTTWTRYTVTGTVPSNATEVGSFFYWIPTGTAGADDAVYITGIQLEKGSVATPFEYRPIGTELALCQRYYETGSGAYGVNVSGTAATVRTFSYFKVTKRTGSATTAVATGAVDVVTDSGFSSYQSSIAGGAVYNPGGFTANAEL